MGMKGLRRETIPVDFYFFFFPHSFHRGEWKIIEILKTDDPSFPNERLIESSPPHPLLLLLSSARFLFSSEDKLTRRSNNNCFEADKSAFRSIDGFLFNRGFSRQAFWPRSHDFLFTISPRERRKRPIISFCAI